MKFPSQLGVRVGLSMWLSVTVLASMGEGLGLIPAPKKSSRCAYAQHLGMGMFGVQNSSSLNFNLLSFKVERNVAIFYPQLLNKRKRSISVVKVIFFC